MAPVEPIQLPGTPGPVHHNNVAFSLVSGAVAGIAAKTCIAPAERIKMSFQVSSDPFTVVTALEKGKSMMSSGGVISLWKGHSTTVLRVGPYAGISYMVHDYAENYFKSTQHSNVLPPMHKFMAGALGGLCGTVLTYPLDVLRVRLALGSSWQGSISQGGYFQGILPTVMGIIPYAGTAWLAKQSLLEFYVATENRAPRILDSLLINTVAGIFGQFVTYPLDVVRRRMQVAVSRDGLRPTMSRVVGHLVETEGWRGLAKGFSVNIVKGPVSLSISLTVFDYLKRYETNNYNGGG